MLLKCRKIIQVEILHHLRTNTLIINWFDPQQRHLSEALPITSENLTIDPPELANGARVGKIVLITNRKSLMVFRLVLISVTMNDLERYNGRVVCINCVISPCSVAFGACYIKLVEDTPTHSASEM